MFVAALPSFSYARATPLDWQTVSAQDKSALVYAVVVGTEDALPLYACRTPAGAGLISGRYRPDFDGCHVGVGGKEVSVTDFEVLTTSWLDESNGAIPPDSFAAGQRATMGAATYFNVTPLNPCRTAYQASIQVGEVAAGDRGCSFAFGGRQVTEAKYQVLIQAPWMTWTSGIPRQLPVDAVPAGTEGGEMFYICRASDRTGLHTGKIKGSASGCSIVSQGREVVTTQFAILVPRWVAGNAGTIPISALPVGFEKDNLVYLCRTLIRNAMQVGKINDQMSSCHVGMLGGELSSQAYEVLSER